MAKIPFDIKFRPQIESGEYKVETNFGSPVEIVCWNRRDDTANKAIVGIIRDGTVEEIAAWNIFGKLCDAAFPQNPAYDLFLVTPEPELTEFEKALESFYNHHLQVCTYDNQGTVDDSLHDGASKLLSLARKQLQPEIDAMLEDAYKTADEVQYRKGREEALKDLPRWKPSNCPRSNLPSLYLTGDRTALYKDGYEISISDLEKLPKEETNL